jgi:hypothetical protein
VEQGGTLITEGSTATIFPEYGLTTGVTVEEPPQLFVRGSILRGRITDAKSPITYGYGGTELPVYFSQAPVLNAGTGRGGGPGAAQNPNAGVGQNITPNATPLRISPFEADSNPPRETTNERPASEDVERLRQETPARGRRGDSARPRVVMQFPENPNDLLLSGTIANGQYLSGRAIAVDQPLGLGHVVMFAIRPFWRWQTQGTYPLGFNAILNWNDLDAGR